MADAGFALPVTQHTKDLAVIFIASSATLLALAIGTLIVRIYTRLRPSWQVGLDDYFILAGFGFAVACWAMLVRATEGFLDFDVVDLKESMEGNRLGFLAVIIWAWAMTFIKTSIALTLLRFQRSRGWVMFLYVMIGLLICEALAVTFFVTLQCRPMSRIWDFKSTDGACMTAEAVRDSSNTTASLNIATDIILALTPLSFLTKLRRPLREKILLSVLMATGLLASAASIAKTMIVQKYGDPNEDMNDLNVVIPQWTAVEMFIGVIAACLPNMKLPIQKCLERFGFATWSRGTSTGRPTGVLSAGTYRTADTRLRNLQVQKARGMGVSQEELTQDEENFDNPFDSPLPAKSGAFISAASSTHDRRQSDHVSEVPSEYTVERHQSPHAI